MTAREIAEKTNRSVKWIYYLKKQYGRLPTVEEVEKRKGKFGRPIKYRTKE